MINTCDHSFIAFCIGDSDRFQETESVCQESYRLPCTDPLSQQLKYDKHSAHAITYQSSLNLGDPVRFNEMKTTFLPLYGKTGSFTRFVCQHL